MSAEIDNLKRRITSIEKSISRIETVIESLNKDVKSKIGLNQLSQSEDSTSTELETLSDAISSIEKKLAYINTPDTTKYYLEQSEVDLFRSNFSQLRSMLTRFEKLYKNLVAYSATLK